MAKKKMNPESPTAPAPPAAPRRRAPAKKKAEPLTVAPAANGDAPEPTQAEIAEAAYFRHLRRGGAEGDEFNDWVEAERELRERHSRTR
jgi:hypothetical protein